MIIDWDLHHGNGTAEIFSHRPDVLFANIHQSGPLPWHRRVWPTSAPAPAGATRVNLPVPARHGGSGLAVAD